MNYGNLSRIVFGLLPLMTCLAASGGLFGPKGSNDDEKRQSIRRLRDDMLKDLFQAKPELRDRLKQAVGYATFKQSDVNLFLLASGQGYGLLVDHRTGKEVFMRVASLGGGVGLGIKDLRVIFIFHDPEVMETFVTQGWQFGGKADASAKYHDQGVSAEQAVKGTVDFRQGTIAAGASTDARAGAEDQGKAAAAVATRGAIETYQFTESGVSLQATVAGTKYWKDTKLNE